MTETVAPVQRSASVSAIAARDFNQDTTDPLRDRWSPGALRHLIAAAKGSQVTIVLDTMTGNAQTGVTLEDVRPNAYGGHQMLVTYRWGAGENEVNRTWHPIEKMGAVLVHDTTTARARWDALGTFRGERSAALTIGRERLAAKYPGVELRGEWTCYQSAHFVDVSFRPDHAVHSYRSSVRFQTWRLRLSELA